MMKEIKQRGFSSKVFLVALSLVVVAGVFIAFRRGKIQENSKSILEQQRFIVVDDSGDENLYRSYFENGYDLRSNNSYSKTQVVVKNGEKYGSYSDEKPSDRYHRDLYRNITSWSRFSYPYKTESEFNKKLDEEIQRIKDIEEEYELEKKNG